MNENLKGTSGLQTFEIHQEGGATAYREGIVKGVWAYRLIPFSGGLTGWSVTHLPTGTALRWWWETEAQVEAFVDAVEQELDRIGVDAWISDYRLAYRTLVQYRPLFRTYASITHAAGTIEFPLHPDHDDA